VPKLCLSVSVLLFGCFPWSNHFVVDIVS
jgi:hypothetical protein